MLLTLFNVEIKKIANSLFSYRIQHYSIFMQKKFDSLKFLGENLNLVVIEFLKMSTSLKRKPLHNQSIDIYCTAYSSTRRQVMVIPLGLKLFQQSWRKFCNLIRCILQRTPFFYKQSIFDPRPENSLSFSKKSPQKIV